jgi:hypothetical protein
MTNDKLYKTYKLQGGNIIHLHVHGLINMGLWIANMSTKYWITKLYKAIEYSNIKHVFKLSCTTFLYKFEGFESTKICVAKYVEVEMK